MRFQRQPRHLVIGDDMLGVRHRRQRGIGLLAKLAGAGCGEQRQRRRRRAAHFPQGIPPVERHRAEGIGVGEQPERALRDVGAARKLFDRGEVARHARRHDGVGPFLAETGDLAETEAQRVGGTALTLPIADAMGPFPLPIGEGGRRGAPER